MNKKATSKKGKLKPEARRAAENLKRIWEARAKSLGLTQEIAGAAAGAKKNPQAYFWQLKEGQTPLNWRAVKGLAAILEVRPGDIYPELDEQLGSPGDRRTALPPDALEVAHLYRQLNPIAQQHLRSYLEVAVHLIRSGMDITFSPDERLTEMAEWAKNHVERRQH